MNIEFDTNEKYLTFTKFNIMKTIFLDEIFLIF